MPEAGWPPSGSRMAGTWIPVAVDAVGARDTCHTGRVPAGGAGRRGPGRLAGVCQDAIHHLGVATIARATTREIKRIARLNGGWNP